jgi:uncharacterized membrane protein YkvA (DUF1232 family)
MSRQEIDHGEQGSQLSGFLDQSQVGRQDAKTPGRETIGKALVDYCTWMRPETPLWANSIIAGALPYFICPVDAVPDVIPSQDTWTISA